MSELDFSKKEIEFLRDLHFFELKTAISQKIIRLFCEIEADLKTTIKESSFTFPVNVFQKGGKISKGENYNNYPYFVLDYPRLFSRKDIFSFRSVLWWGNYLSNNFLIAGQSLDRYREHLLKKIPDMHNTAWKICIESTPWRLENDDSNLVELSSLGIRKTSIILKSHPFIKLSAIYHLEDIKSFKGRTNDFVLQILDLLG